MKLLILSSLFIILLVLSQFLVFQHNEEENSQFKAYQRKWDKNYESQDIEEYRRTIFYANLAKIEQFNSTPGNSWWMAVNQFTDLTQEEFEAIYIGGDQGPSNNNYNHDLDGGNINLSDIDWSQKGGVSPVKNQGSCGGCYSFAAVANSESLNLIFGSRSLAQYSEQMIIDCSRPYGNNGCDGGLATNALQFIKEKGVVLQSQYPYKASAGSCQIQTGSFKVRGVNEWNQRGCDEMVNQLQNKPLAVRVYANYWNAYGGGIFTKCDAPAYGHAVFLTAVAQSAGYWKIKNSWGPTWGEGGFIRLKYPGNCCNVCGDFSSGYL